MASNLQRSLSAQMNGGGGRGVVVVGWWGGVQMPLLTAENSHFLRSGSQEAALVMHYNTPCFSKSEPAGSGHFQLRWGASTPLQCLNHWAIKVLEPPSHFCLVRFYFYCVVGLLGTSSIKELWTVTIRSLHSIHLHNANLLLWFH